MRRFSATVAGIWSSLAVFQVAAAADLPVKVTAPVAPPPTWEGFYIGGHGGYGWDPADATFNPATYVNATAPAFTIASSSGPVSLSVLPEGWLGGFQLGYNWQRDSWVYGLAADVSFSDIEDSDSAPWFAKGIAIRLPIEVTGIVRLKQKLDYFGTIRGRIGWANNSLLFYATGGAAWGHVKTEFSNSDINVSGAGVVLLPPGQLSALEAGGYASVSDIRWGFAVGGGFEWMFARNWTAKAEYLFIDLLGNDTLTIIGGTATAGDMTVNVVRAGINYLFPAQ